MDDKEIKDIEAGLPSLLEKLKDMQQSLTPEEAAAFECIVRSAAKHTEVVEAAREGYLDKINYMKPMSVHATDSMRQQFLAMPKTFKFDR